MAETYEMISRKEYTEPTPVGYVGLKQYTLIQRGQKRFVIIRFFNDLGVRIDKLFFTLEQIGSDGRVLEPLGGELEVCVGLDAGISFEKELEVDAQCVAVKVLVSKVRSCGDEYFLKNGQIEVVTDADAMKKLDISSKLLIPKNKKKRKDRWKLTVIAVAAAMTVFVINLLVAFLNTIN